VAGGVGGVVLGGLGVELFEGGGGFRGLGLAGVGGDEFNLCVGGTGLGVGVGNDLGLGGPARKRTGRPQILK